MGQLNIKLIPCDYNYIKEMVGYIPYLSRVLSSDKATMDYVAYFSFTPSNFPHDVDTGCCEKEEGFR